MTDKTFVIKKKDKERYEKELKSIESNLLDISSIKKYDEYLKYKKELEIINNDIWLFQNSLNTDIKIMKNLIESQEYIIDDTITVKGIIASSINECNEVFFTEMIYRGLLDNIEFPEIIAILSAFINEKDQGGEEKYISDLNVSNEVKYILKELDKIGNFYMNLESEYQLYIENDYKLYLDFIESAYIWASGGTIHDVYKYTSIYDGNFVKAIMRLNNICENLMDICKSIERYDICSKIENYNSILIRDITSINSLYVR
jgi:superfamily II RNA helicase